VALQALDRGHEPPERAGHAGDRVVHRRVRGEDRQLDGQGLERRQPLDLRLREADPVGEDPVREAAPARMLGDVEEVGPHHDLAARERQIEPTHVGQLVEEPADLVEGELVAAHLLLATVLDHAVAMDALLVAPVGELEMDVEGRPIPVRLGADQRHQRGVTESRVLSAAFEDHRLSPVRRRSIETSLASASRSMNSIASARIVGSGASNSGREHADDLVHAARAVAQIPDPRADAVERVKQSAFDVYDERLRVERPPRHRFAHGKRVSPVHRDNPRARAPV